METQAKQRIYVLCGIMSPIIFTVLVIIASLIRPGYSQTYNFVSDLGLGPYAIIQNINFVFFGLLTIIFAFSLKGGFPDPQKRSLKIGIWLVIIFGLGVLFAGVFPEDYLSQGPHNLVSATAFVSIIAAQILVWQGLKSADDLVWAKYRNYSLVSGLLSLILVIVLKMAISDFSDYQGLAQRAFLAVPWIWVEITALKLYSLL
jgi:hypothetical membrane protein